MFLVILLFIRTSAFLDPPPPPINWMDIGCWVHSARKSSGITFLSSFSSKPIIFLHFQGFFCQKILGWQILAGPSILSMWGWCPESQMAGKADVIVNSPNFIPFCQTFCKTQKAFSEEGCTEYNFPSLLTLRICLTVWDFWERWFKEKLYWLRD